MITLISNTLILDNKDLCLEIRELDYNKRPNKLAYTDFKHDIQRLLPLYDIVLFRGYINQDLKIRY